jgi:hypothetical protein
MIVMRLGASQSGISSTTKFHLKFFKRLLNIMYMDLNRVICIKVMRNSF